MSIGAGGRILEQARAARWGRWTRTQRIRTVSQIPVEAPLLEVSPPPLYQQIASRARHLRELGMSHRQIGQALGVTPKTAAKAIAWRGATQ